MVWKKVRNRSGGMLESWGTVGFERRLRENDAEETQHTLMALS